LTTVGATDRAGSVSGVQLAQGVGVQEAKGFWADAWLQVVKRRGAVVALTWLSCVVALGFFAPFIANGHPLILRELGADGAVTAVSSPLFRNLSSIDLALAIAGVVGFPFVLLGFTRGARLTAGKRLGMFLFAGILIGAALIVIGLASNRLNSGSVPDWVRSVRRTWWFPYVAAGVLAAIVGGIGAVLPVMSGWRRWATVCAAVVVATVAGSLGWQRPLQVFKYQDREVAGEVRATYVLIPFSPEQRYSELNRLPPRTELGPALKLPAGSPPFSRRFHLGTDAFGQDVLTHLIYACRLSISIGLVSTGISVLIGVTIGAMAGYFGGWVDMFLQRVIEVFMAVPVLFLLIVAAGVLPGELRNTYVTMAIIGLFSWTGSARFTRAEFYKLRSQDFVQSARAVGLPLRSILFKHMLPNGVTPVLVDASFAVAAAILAEATLSFLGLGPVDSASWGKLLSSSMNTEGEFKWWLAIFPGVAIFLTVLSYNMLGESLRDAIDPKLKKARV
jgi:peptide/nickel transport system permease protein